MRRSQPKLQDNKYCSLCTVNLYGLSVAIIVLLLPVLGLGRHATAADAFQISGYYLGATPKELGVAGEGDLNLGEKFFETEAKGARLFFIRVQDSLRLYRIIKEESTNEENIKSILEILKGKYGPPDKQQIKTSSIRPKYRMKYVTTAKNRAIWKISESQEFIAEIESNKISYELIDHDPENIKPPQRQGDLKDNGFGFEKWDPDY